MAATLSGGLDSSSVALTAAQMLLAEDRSLTAYTGVPLSDDELTIATTISATNGLWQRQQPAALPNIQHYPVRSKTVTPLDGVRQALWVHDGPVHAASNAYWLYDLMLMARAAGSRVLLTGQMGNLGMSWPGIRDTHYTPGLRHKLRTIIPQGLFDTVRRQRLTACCHY